MLHSSLEGSRCFAVEFQVSHGTLWLLPANLRLMGKILGAIGSRSPFVAVSADGFLDRFFAGYTESNACKRPNRSRAWQPAGTSFLSSDSHTAGATTSTFAK